jgi:NAD(P)-dependent dehydrogenase (short-subunit alcohol dehydrogenase family)
MGRVAVVTGASRGLGAGLAEHFAASGLRLGLCARTRPDIPSTSGDREPPVIDAVDVIDHDHLALFADEVVARFGRIDLWVNNAGLLGPIGPLADADPRELRRVVDVNVTGALNGTSVFARHVRSRPGGGVLVNISSGAATSPIVGWATYCSSKAALDQLTRVVALEEADHGLAAYSVSPGLVDTDMQAVIRATDEATFPDVARFRRAAAEQRFNSPAWVAEQILALAFGPDRPDTVVLRVPDQSAGAGLAG